MKKKFIFTKDSSFTNVQDEMHQSVTEHIIEDDETKKFYHIVVSYGSWFRVSYESIFMSHLLKKIGVTGFCVAYSADECEIRLPWYPYHKIETKSIVELPEFVKLEDFNFGRSNTTECENFKQTFIGKTFKTTKSDSIGKMEGKELLKYLFSCSPFKFGEVMIKDEVYSLYCILYGASWHGFKDFTKLLEETEFLSEEVKDVMTKFVEIDIEKEIKSFEEEIGADFSQLKLDLVDRQVIIKNYLHTHELDVTV